MSSQNNPELHRDVVVVGGGAAGWLTAAIIAAEHNVKTNPHVSVTLVESPDVKILGVGEGTWPTMRDTLRKIGIAEHDFLRQCDASFKQGTCFRQWVTNADDDCYYHPFDLPAGFFDADIVPWWQRTQPNAAFAELFSTQPALCAQYKAPKQAQTPPYAAVANYGYHLDANKFAELLKHHSITSLGVRYVRDHIDSVRTDETGAISELQGREGAIAGSLFIDCSGFAARLIGQHFKADITPVTALKNDSAMAVQAPYKDSTTPIQSATLSTARQAGWIWDIGLPTRKGVGYVYSSAHTDDETARATLLAYLEADTASAPVSEENIRKISFTPGYRATPWLHNCVAVGTSAGFLEPLEASALVMIELAANDIARLLPASGAHMTLAAAQFNQKMQARWARIVDFLKLHYVLSARRDSPYWQAMTDRQSASSQLQAWLTLWQTRPPHADDFIYNNEIFPVASYLYILFGMGYKGQADAYRFNQARLDAAESAIRQSHQRQQQQLAGLPDNRALLNELTARATHQVS